MIRYTGTAAQDALLVAWWGRLTRSGELPTILPGHTTLGGFFDHFRAQAQLWIAVDPAKGIMAAAWFYPFFSGVAMGLWFHESWRSASKSGLAFVDNILTLAFQKNPLVAFWSRDVAKVETYVHYGFTLAGKIPGLLQGQTGYLGYMTRARFVEVRGRAVAVEEVAT